ncbi:Protein SDA1 homolog [Seminavis robusta]|uniref:Protein SDA1 n=1 Tax=Seminavis robusta TaxID=568900 RepID=A0A9N8HM51_9STRA|nr:Protein SDA1 homolog [Seminavis robusta]|eukprot:Sro868_g213380.1 Protein SDA1 homolog (866) ;mRNA; r:37495-40092
MVGTGGIATGAGTRVDVTLKLSQLQNLCKRDPQGYREDYDAQVRRLESECGILALSPLADPSPRLVELIQFAAAVSSSSYKGAEANRIAQLLMNLLLGKKDAVAAANTDNNNAANAQSKQQQVSKEEKQQAIVNVTSLSTWALQLHRDIRKACVSALILMRNKGAVEPLQLLELFFRIMSVVPDKALREILFRHIVNDIRNINKKGKRDDKVNRSIQSFLHRVISTHGNNNINTQQPEDSATDVASKRACEMVCELYRRNVWTDERTVAILTSAIQSKNTTVMSRAIRFFLNVEEKMALDAKEEEESEWLDKNHIDYHQHSKKTQGRLRHVTRQLKNRKKHQKKREGMDGGENWSEQVDEDNGVEQAKKLYPAIELIHDPQGLAEAVFQRVRGAGKAYKYYVKLLMINFITRLVGNHELIILPLYPFLQKYMGGHQRDVTAILAYSVQACHEHVPPEEVYGILKTIAHNFITERCSEEQMAVGINAARAICARVPTVMNMEESKGTTGSTVMDMEAFARDLAGFGNHRDRSVSIAGKAWQNFVREVNPGLLQGKHRGLKGSALHKSGTRPRRYGEDQISAGVAGADLLVEYESKKAAYLKRKQAEQNEGVGEDEDGWVEAEDSDDDEAPQLVVLKDHDGDKKPAAKEDSAGAEDADDEDDNDNADDDQASKDDNEKSAANQEENQDDKVIDLSKMTPEERAKLRMEVSATRSFTPKDFGLMRRLVEREQRAKRDPREAARRKRALAKGDGFEELSGDDESDSDSDEDIHVAGAVNPTDIMASATRKRQSKAERLAKVVAGREQFESTARTGGSTNVEKKRKKNFVMSKFSFATRTKGNGKKMLADKRKGKGGNMSHEGRKRRRKF